MSRNVKYAGPGEPRRASQRHHHPPLASLPAAFVPGDRVRWNGRYVGEVRRIVGDEAEVVENEILGRRATWRLSLAALSRA
jgi:hypothetical protein